MPTSLWLWHADCRNTGYTPSEIDTDLLGHSYYGDCLPILDDVNLLMRSSLPPLERRLRPWPVDEQLLYWTLPEAGP